MAAPFSYLPLGAAPTSGVPQVETATVVGTITVPGNVEVVVTAAGMTGSPITVNVATGGQLQAEVATVVGTIGAAGAGNAAVIVTAAGMTGSPKTVAVAVANDDTAAQVAGKIRTALAADADVGDAGTGFFTVSGSGAEVILTAKVAAADDATINISIDNDTCAGLTAAPTSRRSAAGIAGDAAATVAGRIREALAAHAVIGVFFAVSGSGADIVLTRARSAANDATLNLAYGDGTTSGLTPDATSANTTAGVLGTYRGAPAGQVLADTTNGNLYVNTGDENRPVWTAA